MKAEFGKFDNIDKLVIVPRTLNGLNAKVKFLNGNKLKIVPIELKKLSDIVKR